MRDAVVVGAGMGGLAAASQLAVAGWRVRLVEASDELGGKAGTATVDGVRFDTGPSVLTLPDVVADLFRDAGEDWRDHVELVRSERPFRYAWPDGTTLDVFADRGRTVGEVERVFGPQHARAFGDFLDYAAAIWSRVADAFVLAPAPSVARVLAGGPGVWASALRIDAFRTMAEAVRAQVREPHLQDVLLRYATYNGSDPERAPATLHCIAHVELTLGQYGVRGGMGTLVDALEALLVRQGVEIVRGHRVDRVIVSRDAARGVRLDDGSTIEATACVLNCDADAVAPLLGLPSPTARGPRSMSGWTAVLRATRRSDRPAHMVLFPSDYRREFADVFDRGRFPIDPAIYCCAQEPAHGIAGWPAHEPVFVMANAPAGGTETPADFAERIRTTLVDRGIVESDDAIVWSRTPRELAARFPGSAGSLYGRASHGWDAAFRRPPNRVPGVRGLALASGSAHPGGGVPLALLSGREAARCVLADGVAS
jgi:phytoene desaturase